jgi:hypothetical protein
MVTATKRRNKGDYFKTAKANSKGVAIARPRRRGDRMNRRGFISLVQRGGIMRSMTFCATILSLIIATAEDRATCAHEILRFP